MEDWLTMLAAIASDPIAAVALVLAAAMCLDMVFVDIGVGGDAEDPDLSPEERRDRKRTRRSSRNAVDALRGMDLRIVAQAVEDMIIDREHLTRILGTRALDLWIDLDIDERHDGPTLRTRAKIVAFEPAPLDEARIAQSARMIKRRVVEELTHVLGPDADRFVNGGVTIETAIERSA
ncbi:MAG: hypothetical protein PVI23_13875 [Maricaulaceae bacterium]|jgi:hypothetical protein